MNLFSLLTRLFVLPLLVTCTTFQTNGQSAERAMTHNRLPPCPSSPNCVCSEYPDQDAHVSPVVFSADATIAWERAANIVAEMGGEIVTRSDDHLHATFTSAIFRFIDDLELRLDRENSTIHLRSASRTGYWDFGVNRKRAERFRAMFANLP